MPNPQPIVVKRGEARNTDILCGRGNGVLCHPGNIYYLKLIKKHQSIYQHGKGGMQSLSQREKRKIVRHIIESIDELDPPGRFLKLVGRDTEHGFEEIYHVIKDDDTRMKKVSQALREKPKKANVMKEQQQQDEDQRRMEAIERSHQRNDELPSHYMNQGEPQNNMTEQQRYMAMLSQQHAHNMRENGGSMMFSPDNPNTTPRGGGFFNPKRRLPYSEALRHPDAAAAAAAAAAANMMIPPHKRQRLQHPGNFPMPPPPPHHPGHHHPHHFPHMMHRHPHPGHQHHPRHQGFPPQNRRFNLNELSSSQGGNNTPSRLNGNGASGPEDGGSNRASPCEKNGRTNDNPSSNDEGQAAVTATNGGGEGTEMPEMNKYDLAELKRSNEEMKERYRRTLVDCVRLAEMIQRSEIAQSQFSANQLQSHLRNLHSMSTSSSSPSAAVSSNNAISSSSGSVSREQSSTDKNSSESIEPQDKKNDYEKISGEYIEKASIQNLSALMSVQLQEASIAAAIKNPTGPNKETKEDDNALISKKLKSENIQSMTKDVDTVNKPVKKVDMNTEAALLLNFASVANTEKEQDNETETEKEEVGAVKD